MRILRSMARFSQSVNALFLRRVFIVVSWSVVRVIQKPRKQVLHPKLTLLLPIPIPTNYPGEITNPRRIVIQASTTKENRLLADTASHLSRYQGKEMMTDRPVCQQWKQATVGGSPTKASCTVELNFNLNIYMAPQPSCDVEFSGSFTI
jgi:hypothetical protein